MDTSTLNALCGQWRVSARGRGCPSGEQRRGGRRASSRGLPSRSGRLHNVQRTFAGSHAMFMEPERAQFEDHNITGPETCARVENARCRDCTSDLCRHVGACAPSCYTTGDQNTAGPSCGARAIGDVAAKSHKKERADGQSAPVRSSQDTPSSGCSISPARSIESWLGAQDQGTGGRTPPTSVASSAGSTTGEGPWIPFGGGVFAGPIWPVGALDGDDVGRMVAMEERSVGSAASTRSPHSSVSSELPPYDLHPPCFAVPDEEEENLGGCRWHHEPELGKWADVLGTGITLPRMAYLDLVAYLRSKLVMNERTADTGRYLTMQGMMWCEKHKITNEHLALNLVLDALKEVLPVSVQEKMIHKIVLSSKFADDAYEANCISKGTRPDFRHGFVYWARRTAHYASWPILGPLWLPDKTVLTRRKPDRTQFLPAK